MEKKKKVKEIKKKLYDFIKDEEGLVSKENILKIGLGTISALGILSSFSNAYAGHTNHSSHANNNYLTQESIPSTHCYRIRGDHTSHASHSSHNSY